MLNVVRKSILRKLFVHFIVFGCVVGIATFAMYSMDYKTVTLEVFAISLGVFVLYFLLTYFYFVVRPIKILLRQMEALLTGRKYKKINTDRIDEIGVIAHFFNEVTKNLGSLAGSIKENRRLSGELELAAELQQKILPDKTPPMPGLSFATKSRPAAEVGGDSFDFIPLEQKTYFYVGDVTGHGVPAGLVMTMAHALIRVFSEIKANAYEVLVESNKHLKQYIRSNMFMTMLFFSWDHIKKSMTYVGAGHEYLLVFRATTGECDRLPSGGIALGMVPDNSKLIKETEVPLDNGDVMLVFTDGIVEAQNEAGEMYGLDRLQEKFTEYSAQYGVDDIHKHLALDFSQFVGNHSQDDDITLMVIKKVDDEGHSGVSSTK